MGRIGIAPRCLGLQSLGSFSRPHSIPSSKNLLLRGNCITTLGLTPNNHLNYGVYYTASLLPLTIYGSQNTRWKVIKCFPEIEKPPVAEILTRAWVLAIVSYSKYKDKWKRYAGKVNFERLFVPQYTFLTEYGTLKISITVWNSKIYHEIALASLLKLYHMEITQERGNNCV